MVEYFIGDVITHFEDWLGCATKRCKYHKKNIQVCHIKPGSKVYPTVNGLYECEECHSFRPRSLNEMYLPDDTNPNLSYDARMSKAESERLQGIMQFHNEQAAAAAAVPR